MKKTLLTLFLLVALAAGLSAQVTPAQPKYLGKKAADPATCTVTTPTWYFNTVSSVFKFCSATNIYSPIGSGSTGTFSAVDLGNTTDATLSRSSAGVLAVEGVTVDTISATNTLTNKRITSRVSTTASSTTPTPNADTDDMYTVTALAAGATFGAPTGTPTDGQRLIIRIKDNGTARSLAFNAAFRFSSDLAAPSTTILSKTLYMVFVWNAVSLTWDNLSQLNNF